MELLGSIVRLQVQTTSLKVGERLRSRYDPSGIVPVSSFVLDPGGVTVITDTGDVLDDVHHAEHDQTKNRGTNAVSFIVTAHYSVMRDHFGDHLSDGIAGENILVQFDRVVTEAEFASGIRIVNPYQSPIDLDRVIVAEPCVEFARYALKFPDELRPDRTVAAAVTFLSAGVRGFYAAYSGRPTTVQLGDLVYIR